MRSQRLRAVETEAAQAGRLLRRAVASAPLTCGEFVQGLLDGVQFLVSCPINRRARAEAQVYPQPAPVARPADAWKSRAAVARVCALLGLDPATVAARSASGFPAGKGFGTSTADVVGCIQAVANAATGRPLAPRQVAEIACAVEPSDGVMFPALAAFAHRDGKLVEALPAPPAMTIIALDAGGTVDSVEFNRRDHLDGLRRNAPAVERAFQLLRDGLRERSIEGIGAAATLSGAVHQSIMPNPLWPEAERWGRANGAAGLVLAHSGTVIGFLFDCASEEASVLTASIRRHFGDGLALRVIEAAPGGTQIESPD